jgi:glycosyltransferase involved in cell wall biosynthesis
LFGLRIEGDSALSPTFSVIMPTYNRANTIARAVRSVLGQTWTDFELIIVDDGSTDETRQVVGNFDDPRIRYVHQENAGQASAKNLGASLAQAPYVTFLDSDDEALAEWLEHFAGGFERSDVGLVCGGVVQIMGEGSARKEIVILPRDYGPLFDHRKLFLVSGSFATRNSLFQAVNGYRNKASRLQIDLAIRLIPYCVEHGQTIVSLPVPVIRWYRHEDSRISTNPVAQYRGARQMLEDYGELMLAKDRRRYGVYCNIAGVSALNLGETDEARRFLCSAIRHYPWYWKFYARFFVALCPPLARRLMSVKRGT